jgi:hypothetical protein
VTVHVFSTESVSIGSVSNSAFVNGVAAELGGGIALNSSVVGSLLYDTFLVRSVPPVCSWVESSVACLPACLPVACCIILCCNSVSSALPCRTTLLQRAAASQR